MRVALMALALAASGGTATQAVQNKDAEIRAMMPPMGTEPTAAQKQKAQDALAKFIDFRGMAQAALGKQWAKMSEAKRTELLDAFTKRLRGQTGSQVDFYRSTDIKFEPETQDGGVSNVPTSMVVKDEPTHVTYAMKQTKAGWQIEDIVIDDLSTIETYRSQFTKVINKEGVDGLIARLEKQPAAQAPDPADAGK